MKIVFFSHYFPPEVNAPATRTFEHCRRWVQAGHEVTVVTCAPNCPDGVVFDGYQNRCRRQVEEIDGIRVVRVWTYVAPNAGTLRRIINFLSYFLSSLWVSRTLSRPDIVIATSPQFFCGWAGIWVARFKRCPLVLEIRDIWPESIAAVGAMRRGPIIQFLEWLERRMYLAADHIVAVGTGYRDKITAKFPAAAGKISVITNGIDAASFPPQSADRRFLRQHGLEGKFVCSYVGTIGMAHGLDVVIAAARELLDRGRDDIAFLLVGDGANRRALEAQAEREGVGALVRFTGRMPRTQVPAVLASSSCCLVHLKGTELFGTVIPSKIFESMAMERPIIMGVKGPARDIVTSAGGGLPMEPDDAHDLVRVVTEMADSPVWMREAGRSARRYVVAHYDRDRLAGELCSILATVAGERDSETLGSVIPIAMHEKS